MSRPARARSGLRHAALGALAHLRADRGEVVGQADLQDRDAARAQGRDRGLRAVLAGKHEVGPQAQHGLGVGPDLGQTRRLGRHGGERRIARERAQGRDLLRGEEDEELVGAEVERDDALGGAGGGGERERSQEDGEAC